MNSLYIFLVLFISCVSAANYEFEQTGTYSVNPPTPTRGDVYALLTRGQGWNRNSEHNKRQTQVNVDVIPSGKFPFSEILRIVEAFLVLKGEVASKLAILFAENSQVIKAVVTTLIGKIGTLHKFTIVGIVILRKVLEFAAQLFGHWSVDVDINQGISSLFS